MWTQANCTHLGTLVICVNGLFVDYVVDLSQDLVECLLHVGGLQG